MGISINTDKEKVLGVLWDVVRDKLCFKVKINHIKKLDSNSSFTKRIALSTVNGIFDPIGLGAPVTVQGKMLLRELTSIEPRLCWDDPIPDSYRQNWDTFLGELECLQDLEFARCVKPDNAMSGPILVTFSDASECIFGSCCYFTWGISTGSFKSALILSKNRVAPIKRLSIVRLELSAAVLAVRMRRFIFDNCRFNIERVIHIVDSEIVRSMIQKESYGFNTFAGTRLGEIQTHSKPNEWFRP